MKETTSHTSSTTDIRHIVCMIIVSLCSQFFSVATAQSLTISGSNWSVPIVPITEAGNDYAGTYESAANQVLLNASVPLLLGAGKVSVRYEANPTWNNALNISVQRTGNGTTLCLLCSINGGTAYQPISTIDTELFRITAVVSLASYSNIPIQLRVSGVSVAVPAANYNARIIFTIGAL